MLAVSCSFNGSATFEAGLLAVVTRALTHFFTQIREGKREAKLDCRRSWLRKCMVLQVQLDSLFWFFLQNGVHCFATVSNREWECGPVSIWVFYIIWRVLVCFFAGERKFGVYVFWFLTFFWHTTHFSGY